MLTNIQKAINAIISSCQDSESDNRTEFLISQTYYEEFDVNFVRGLLKEAEYSLSKEKISSLRKICLTIANAQDNHPIISFLCDNQDNISELGGDLSTLGSDSEDFTTDGQ